MPEISVVIPVFNTEKYLAECLESVLHQTFVDFEAILVDDGSTDSSADIARNLAERDTRIRIVQQENRGLSEARNTGIDHARGNWITFVDSDDLIAHSFLETLLLAAKQQEAEIACCGKRDFADISGVKELLETNSSCNKVTGLTPEDALTQAFNQKDRPDYSAWNKLYARSLWAQRRFKPGIYFEDMECIPKVFLDATRIAFADTPLYLYRRRDTSILATPYSRKKAELLDIAESAVDLVQGRGRRLEDAARSNLLSASFSILMRTDDTDEFRDYRERAWNHIKKLRIKAIFSFTNRFRNKIASALSFLGKKKLNSVLRRFV